MNGVSGAAPITLFDATLFKTQFACEIKNFNIEDHFDRSLELEENLKGSGKAQVLNQMRHISSLANFCYVRQSEALGLGHAVLCAQHLIGDEPFAVILGDDELSRGEAAVKELATGTQSSVALDRLIEVLR